ncbi:hypothetical protein OUZ56_005599 [Daphnia magna]|uniref:Uncharacterized protein n=1 Tax=Daphnia magna TaxID=35525 RepID=A0ABQ9YT81_9CRUS|nr:hypothetical protein OUZ56_005599 [Daphnia magna]
MAAQNLLDDMSDSLPISVGDENVEDIDSILSQIPLLEIGGKYTITDCNDESMIEEEEEAEEEKMKQRTEKEIEYLQSERNEQRKTINIKIGKEMMEEEEENVERELREKKRKIDMEGREIEMKLRELTKKKNAEMEKKKSGRIAPVSKVSGKQSIRFAEGAGKTGRRSTLHRHSATIERKGKGLRFKNFRQRSLFSIGTEKFNHNGQTGDRCKTTSSYAEVQESCGRAKREEWQ